jgi:hypothetical protein
MRQFIWIHDKLNNNNLWEVVGINGKYYVVERFYTQRYVDMDSIDKSEEIWSSSEIVGFRSISDEAEMFNEQDSIPDSCATCFSRRGLLCKEKGISIFDVVCPETCMCYHNWLDFLSLETEYICEHESMSEEDEIYEKEYQKEWEKSDSEDGR